MFLTGLEMSKPVINLIYMIVIRRFNWLCLYPVNIHLQPRAKYRWYACRRKVVVLSD